MGESDDEVDALWDRLQRGHGWDGVTHQNVDRLIKRAIDRRHKNLQRLLESWKTAHAA